MIANRDLKLGIIRHFSWIGTKNYEIVLVNLETYYSFPNIDESNKVFVYSPDNGNSWKKIKIPEGSYKIDDINNTIHHEMEKTGHCNPINEDYYINISTDSNTLKSVLILEEDYQVDFNYQNSIAKVLGFTSAKYTEGFHKSEIVVNILSINSILVNIDIFREAMLMERGTLSTQDYPTQNHSMASAARGKISGSKSKSDDLGNFE